MVFLESFEIENFRKIKHVRCILSPKITILAGRNEAGKTSILQALEALNEGWTFKETDRPENIQGEKFTLKCKFSINEEEKESWLSKCSIDAKNNSNEVEIIRSNEKPTYIVTGEWVDKILEQIENTKNSIIELEEMIRNINQVLEEKSLPQRITVSEINDSKTDMAQLQGQINPIIPWITQHNPALIPEMTPLFNSINSKISEIINVDEKKQKFLNTVNDFVPHIVYFSSFDDILPSEIPLSEFINEDTLKSNNRGVNDLITLSGLDRQQYAQTDKIGRANMANKASKITSDIFDKHWDQDPIEISFRSEGESVLFFVQDQGNESLFRPDQRSKGLQWYLSFFLRLTAERATNNLILIDEPGLYLHAIAQQNVVGLLEDLSETNQIIFSTHSPYLIDPSKLGRLRLVTFNSKEKEIELNDFNAKADLETLTPIITAIGLDITKGLSFPNKKNIIVEGVSDYYYLQAILHYLKSKEKYEFPQDVAFVPCVGNTNVGTVASLLEGYGFDYKILLDLKGTTKTKNALIRDGVSESKIISVGKIETDSIEELFDDEDQKQFHLKDSEKSKTIISRKFHDQITEKKSKIKLSEKTVKNFKQILNKLKKF